MRRTTLFTGGIIAAVALSGAGVISWAHPDQDPPSVSASSITAAPSTSPASTSGPVAAPLSPDAAPVAVTSSSSAPVIPDAQVLQAKKSVIVGVSTDGLGALDNFITTTGTRPAIYSMFEQWSNDRTLDQTEAEGARQRGMTPSIAWEPWDPRLGVNQPQYSLSSIVQGRHDAYLSAFADSVRQFGSPVIIRLMHEGNGTWYPWDAAVNGNTPGEYIAAWHHVHDLFAQRGVTNAVWEWAPNISTGTPVSLSQLYPGDAYVDQVGLSGYNWDGQQSFDGIFAADLKRLTQITTKDIWISETGSGPADSKARWIQELYAGIARYPQVVGFVWFDQKLDNGQDWRISTSASAIRAWQAGAEANLR